MRSYLALVAAFGSALAAGAVALAQEGGAVFAPAQGGVAVPGVPGGPGLPPRDRGRTAAKGTASIRGRITAAGSNTPLRRAQVAVTAVEGIGRYTTTTDGEGRFDVLELPAAMRSTSAREATSPCSTDSGGRSRPARRSHSPMRRR